MSEILLSFDIEEWFHCDFYSDKNNWDKLEVRIFKNMDFILEKLSLYNKKGTFFILGWIAEKYPEIVKQIYEQGHEIGCHSMYHDLVYNFNSNEFKNDLISALQRIEDVIGEKVVLYRAPAFSINENCLWAFEILSELGITHDASVFSGNHDFGGFNSFKQFEPFVFRINGCEIKEFPMNAHFFLNKAIIFSGGGYFRLIPYQGFKYFSKKSNYVMTYFHPRDFDSQQPILWHLPFSRLFKSYYGLNNAKFKFDKLLSEHASNTILEFSKTTNWLSKTIIEL